MQYHVLLMTPGFGFELYGAVGCFVDEDQIVGSRSHQVRNQSREVTSLTKHMLTLVDELSVHSLAGSVADVVPLVEVPESPNADLTIKLSLQ